MKRSQESTTSPDEGGSPPPKKQKVSPMVSTGLTVEQGVEESSSGWTRVEKRSMKKQKKINAKQEVSTRLFYV